jgi:hypothetical protein
MPDAVVFDDLRAAVTNSEFVLWLHARAPVDGSVSAAGASDGGDDDTLAHRLCALIRLYNANGVCAVHTCALSELQKHVLSLRRSVIMTPHNWRPHSAGMS